MRLAFYAPMKSPDHPVPSGDRNIARGLIKALEWSGAQVDVASSLRARDGNGNTVTQNQIIESAQQEVSRIFQSPEASDWQAWITYHNYYKAPDLLGPLVSQLLGIPYVQIESTRAKKRLTGPWAPFAKAAEAATDAANLVFYFTERDAASLREHSQEGQVLRHLKPFLPVENLPDASTLSGPMLSVGMMRAGDKFKSYQIIADTLTELSGPWTLDIAGDGPRRADIEALMKPFGNKVRFLGQLDPETLRKTYETASLLFWPGVNEALGLVFLEAQAAGVPIVAQNRPGMREVLAPGIYPETPAGPKGLAERIETLLRRQQNRMTEPDTLRDFIAQNHLLPAAAQTLIGGLSEVGVRP